MQGLVLITNSEGQATIHLDGDRGDLKIGGNGQNGSFVVVDSTDRRRLSVEPLPNGIRLRVPNDEGDAGAELTVGLNVASFSLGGASFDGTLHLRTAVGAASITLDGRDGEIELKDETGKTTILISGRSGDIILDGADAAEHFEVAPGYENMAAGTVVVFDDNGQLRPSVQAYDNKVVGVVSGAGKYKPGLVLAGNGAPATRRAPVALIGTVLCSVDAQSDGISVGDLITTSDRTGLGMKARDKYLAHGAIIGKARGGLKSGTGLIPMLVCLR